MYKETHKECQNLLESNVNLRRIKVQLCPQVQLQRNYYGQLSRCSCNNLQTLIPLSQQTWTSYANTYSKDQSKSVSKHTSQEKTITTNHSNTKDNKDTQTYKYIHKSFMSLWLLASLQLQAFKVFLSLVAFNFLARPKGSKTALIPIVTPRAPKHVTLPSVYKRNSSPPESPSQSGTSAPNTQL